MIISDEDQKKIDKISERASELAKKNKCKTAEDNNNKSKKNENKEGAKAGSEFLASVFAGALLGYGIDWYFNTTPWAMIFFIIMGFISGVYRANAATKETYEKNDKS